MVGVLPIDEATAREKGWQDKVVFTKAHAEKMQELLAAGWTILRRGLECDTRTMYIAPTGAVFDKAATALQAFKDGTIDHGNIRASSEFQSQAGKRKVAGVGTNDAILAAAKEAGDITVREASTRAGMPNAQNARRSAASAAARGAGEQDDGQDDEQREAQAQRVATHVNEAARTVLDEDITASVYVAVGSYVRIVTNLLLAKASNWAGKLADIEVIASLLRSSPSAYRVDEDGQAVRFTAASVRKGLQSGSISVAVCEERMLRSSVGKRSEVISHEEVMAEYPHPRTLMKGISFGGPSSGQECGHALGLLVLLGRGSYFVVPEVNARVLEAQASPVYRSKRAELGSDWHAQYMQAAAASSQTAALKPWVRRLICKAEDRKFKDGRLHNKHWSAEFDPVNGSVAFTYGSLSYAFTNQLVFGFGAENAQMASAFAEARCKEKLRGAPKKAPYVELTSAEYEPLPQIDSGSGVAPSWLGGSGGTSSCSASASGSTSGSTSGSASSSGQPGGGSDRRKRSAPPAVGDEADGSTTAGKRRATSVPSAAATTEPMQRPQQAMATKGFEPESDDEDDDDDECEYDDEDMDEEQ